MSNFIKITTTNNIDMLLHKDRIIAVRAFGHEPITARPITRIYVDTQPCVDIVDVDIVDVHLDISDVYQLLK